MSNIPNLNEMLKLHTKNELWERIQHHIKTIDTLRQQLEEKDKEIEELKRPKILCSCDLSKDSEFIKKLNKTPLKIISMQNDTQLAIQKLEKVKELLLVENKNNPIIYDINDDTVGGALDRDKTFEIIDQQIKELKGE